MNKLLIILTFIILLPGRAFTQKDSANPKSILKPDTGLVVFENKPDSFQLGINQKNNKPPLDFIQVETHFGLSKPIGNYADDYYVNPLAGYAREGVSLGFTVFYHLREEVDLMLSWSRQNNTFAVGEFSKVALANRPNYQLKRQENWRNNFVLVGACYNFKLSENNFFTPRFLMGFCTSKTPEYIIEPSNKKATAVTEIIDSEKQTRFALKLGFGLKKNLRRNFTLSLNPDFFYSSTGQNINKRYFNNLISSQSITCISFCVGLGYRITVENTATPASEN